MGSPGGSRIMGYVAQTLVAMLDWSMDAAGAVALPHVGPFNEMVELEESTAAAQLAPMLQDRGLPVRLQMMTSGLNLIRVLPTLSGGADPRREGVVLAE